MDRLFKAHRAKRNRLHQTPGDPGGLKAGFVST
jgi:hypothetical protein